ncbi:MAG: right-handed parallel beta-helix repeat-containing protein [Phycisphaerales bacterium]|nr:right-handed parallel beta-helix repeat-containing protein [Phycisphaerales bacterium]
MKCRTAMPAWLITVCGWAQAEVVTVNTSSDVVDFGGAQRVENLPGPDGRVSLAEAGLASDNTPGVQTIGFAVPQNEWEYQWLFPGRVVLRPFLGFRVFQTAIIDATTQTEFTGDTYTDGGEVVIWQETYIIDNVGGEMRGFDNSSIHISGGSGNILQNNTATGIEIYDSQFNLIGGALLGDGNTGGTIKIDRASNNVVAGNTYARVRVLGWFGGGQPATGNRIGGPTEGERNYITGYGTFSGEGCPGGTTVQIFDSIDTIIEGNWIGTTPDGMSQGSDASTTGIGFEGENYGALIVNNRIAGILARGYDHCRGQIYGTGITLYGTGGGFVIQGNTIGLNALGEPALGSVTGINSYDYYLGAVRNVLIGGAGPGEGNEIAGHLSSGMEILNPLSGIHISGNSIHDNTTLGIDLVPANFVRGVTPNDNMDGDSGGNGLQNFPVIGEALSNGSSVAVSGTFNSLPGRSYSLEFFANTVCDGTGHGEGEIFLGQTRLTTDGAGNASFSAMLQGAAAPGEFLSATATDDSIGDTSEFSACVIVEAGGGVDCGAVRKLKVGCRDGKLVAKVVSSLPESTTLTILRNGGDEKTLTINARGKGKVKWTGQSGTQAVAIIECSEVPEQTTMCL